MIRAIKMKCYLKGCALVGKNTFALNMCYCHLYHKKVLKYFPGLLSPLKYQTLISRQMPPGEGFTILSWKKNSI